jgi:signal transduction histidine kinase
VAVAAGALTVLSAAVALVLHAANRDVAGVDFLAFWPVVVVAALAYGVTGSWLAVVRSRNPVGWLMLLTGAAFAVAQLVVEVAVSVVGTHRTLAGAALWLGSWVWIVGELVVGLVLPLLLPDGRLASRRLRPLLVLAVLLVVANGLAFAVLPYDRQSPPMDFAGLTNPVEVPAVSGPWVAVPLGVLTASVVVVGLGLLVRRWHRSGADERGALSWVLVGLIATVVLGAVAAASSTSVGVWVSAAAAVPLPAAVWLAVLRHRMWDVEVVLSRSLVLVALSAVVVAVYVALVGLLGGALGAGTGAPIVATAVAAVLVLPLHRWLQRQVNRLVFGEAEDPYAMLRRLGARLDAASDPVETAHRVLPEVLAQVTRALRTPFAAVRGPQGVLAAVGTEPAVVDEVPLVFGGTSVGALVVGRSGDGRGRAELRVLHEIAAPLAVTVHAASLADDLRRSRERLVTSREDERRRLHRELHDGVGPALAAAALQIETARELVADDPAAAVALLDRCSTRLRSTVDDVRAVVHGLRPQPLDELGLEGALAELAARFSAGGREVELVVGTLPPRSAAIDVACYLVASEAVTNAVRHGDARCVTVSLAAGGGGVLLTVADDGTGWPDLVTPGMGLRSMRERAEELGGSLVTGPSPVGRGAQVQAWFPVEER